MNPRKVLLVVLDGWGHREDLNHNAIAEAKTPFFNSLWEQYPHALLEASGQHVGLPEGQIGNSEVGHMTIGSGTVIDTDLVKITKSLQQGTFEANSAFIALTDHVKAHDSTLHVMGLVSPGGIHSHSAHVEGILKAIKHAGIRKVVIHAFTDGRDTPPQSAAIYLRNLEALLQDLGIGRIATVSGRFYAMDRDQNWDRLAETEAALWGGAGRTVPYGVMPSEDIEKQYAAGAVDEHLKPVVYLDRDGRTATINPHDGIFFFNFRSDRARMLAQRILEHSIPDDLKLLTMTEYEKGMPCLVAFPPSEIRTTIAKEVSRAGRTQAHIAETEKYAHATYYLNGGVEQPYPGEEHILIPSRKDVMTHDLAPKMRAQEIADATISAINKGTDFIFINFANADMVGHTANKPAIIEAVEEVDMQLKRVVQAMWKAGGVVFTIADHGNAETNVDTETGHNHTAHTDNPVPAIITDATLRLYDRGSLADIAPTVLSLMGLPIPTEMTGKNMILK